MPSVCFVRRRVGPDTGTGRYADGLAAALRAEGVEIDVRHPQRPTAIVPLHRVPLLRRFDLDTFFDSYPLGVPPTSASLLHLASQTLASGLFLGRRRTPTIVTVLDVLPLMWLRQGQDHAFRHWPDRLLYLMAMRGLRRADRLIAISDFTRRSVVDLLAIPARRIEVIYPGVDLSAFCPGSHRGQPRVPRDAPYLLYVGSDDPRKDLSTVVRAIGILRRTGTAMNLVLVGPRQFGPRAEDVRRLAREEGVGDALSALGSVPEAELVDLYRGASGFVMPSAHEGFGLPSVEAMACGCPVIYADAGSSPEVVGAAGVAYRPGDASALADRVGTLLTDRSLATRCREAGLTRARAFTWRNAARQTRALYEDVLGAADASTSTQSRSVR